MLEVNALSTEGQPTIWCVERLGLLVEKAKAAPIYLQPVPRLGQHLVVGSYPLPSREEKTYPLSVILEGGTSSSVR